MGIPYVVLDDNLEAVNYSSYRGGAKSFEAEIEDYRYNWLIPQVLNPIYKRFVETLYLMGVIPEPNAAVEWDPPRFDLLDRGAEAKADEIELRLGTSTWPQLITQRGYDPAKQIEEVKEYKPQLAEAGITFSQFQPAPQPEGEADAK